MTDPADRVRIYEVGPRDGLQNEATPIPTATKRRYIELLVAAGLREIEATSFVSPAAIPQLADADELLPRFPGAEESAIPVLVPNVRGLARAEAAGADAIAVFTAASDAFTTRNIRMTVAESLDAFAPVLARAGELGWWRRGYVSTAFGCPYSGAVEPRRAVDVAPATPRARRRRGLLRRHDRGRRAEPGRRTWPDVAIAAGIPVERIAFHFHDTRGTALANVVAGLGVGRPLLRCRRPAAPVAARTRRARPAISRRRTSSTCSTEWDTTTACGSTGVLEAARFIAAALGRPLASKVGQAGGWDPATGAATGRDRNSADRPCYHRGRWTASCSY